MELVPYDLRRLIKSSLFLDRRQVKVLMYQLLIALNYLHSCGIVHRDLKPENILIKNYCTIKPCDFNLSRSTAGLKSSKFDCDLAIRHKFLTFHQIHLPTICKNSLNLMKEEGAKKALLYTQIVLERDEFEVNFKSGINDSKVKGLEKPIHEDKKEGVATKKLEERRILLSKCKESVSSITCELTGYVGTR
jgi:serine/threonine protein kinase